MRDKSRYLTMSVAQQQVPQTNFLKPYTVTVASMMHIVLLAPVSMLIVYRECSGPIIGGFLVYKLGFPSMAAVRLID